VPIFSNFQTSYMKPTGTDDDVERDNFDLGRMTLDSR
jgi:hypothetical protein